MIPVFQMLIKVLLIVVVLIKIRRCMRKGITFNLVKEINLAYEVGVCDVMKGGN